MSGARRRAGLVAAISIAVLLTAWCRERIDRPRPEPPPQGWNPAEHATQRAEQQTLEMGKVLFLEGTLFRNLRIETDLMLEPGGVAEIFDAIDQQLDDLNPESLDISFRCSQPVVDAVNRVFGGISKHSNLGRAESAVH